MLNDNLQYPSDFNTEVKDATAHLYKGVEKIIPEVEWPFHAPLIHEINKQNKFGVYKRKKIIKNIF